MVLCAIQMHAIIMIIINMVLVVLDSSIQFIIVSLQNAHNCIHLYRLNH